MQIIYEINQSQNKTDIKALLKRWNSGHSIVYSYIYNVYATELGAQYMRNKSLGSKIYVWNTSKIKLCLKHRQICLRC